MKQFSFAPALFTPSNTELQLNETSANPSLDHIEDRQIERFFNAIFEEAKENGEPCPDLESILQRLKALPIEHPNLHLLPMAQSAAVPVPRCLLEYARKRRLHPGPITPSAMSLAQRANLRAAKMAERRKEKDQERYLADRCVAVFDSSLERPRRCPSGMRHPSSDFSSEMPPQFLPVELTEEIDAMVARLMACQYALHPLRSQCKKMQALTQEEAAEWGLTKP